MKAGEKKLDDLLHSPNQFVIPVFQRDYVWKERDWERLWEDIGTLRETNGPAEHFMGSIVSVQMESQPGETPRFLIIDGQQRLITFATLLSALRDEAIRCGIETLPEKIQRHYLTHDLEHGLDRYKILPRLRDRTSFFQLIDGNERPGRRSRVVEAYDSFSARLSEEDADKDFALKEIFTAITAKLSLVTITLSREQNAFSIFSTLNATGQKLEEADLIRNFVFMHVPLAEQDRFDDEHWLPFETSFDAIDGHSVVSLTSFYRDFLMRGGSYVRRDSVYISFQRDEKVAELPCTELLTLLQRYAELYVWIERPSTAPTQDLRRELIRVRRIEQSTAYPLVLHLLHLYKYEGLSEGELLKCLGAITSFVLRRAMTSWSTRAYGRIFTGAIGQLRDSAVLSSLTCFLARKGWPNDKDFSEALIDYPVYRRWPNLTRLMLVAIEDPDAHKEKVDVDGLLADGTLQIEHVMPQSIGTDTAGKWWRSELGEEWEELQRTRLHSIGNLTLTGYNVQLSNKDFSWKKGEFAKSNLRLNEWFAKVDHWTQTEIVVRAEELARTVVGTWPDAVAFEPLAAGIKLDPGEVPARSSKTMAPIRREFWETLAPACEAAGVPFNLSASTDSWVTAQLGLARGNTYLVARTTKGSLVIQYQENWYRTQSLFNWLRANQTAIRSAFDTPLQWTNTPGSYQQYFEVNRFVDLADRDVWPEAIEWVTCHLRQLQTALGQLVGRVPRRDEVPEATLDNFLTDLEEFNPEVLPVARCLVDWASREMSDFYWSTNRGRLSWIPQVKAGGTLHHLVRVMSDGAIEFRFARALKKDPFAEPDTGALLLERVNSIRNVDLPREALGTSVTLPAAMFASEEALDGLLAVLNWFVDKVHGDGSGE